MSQKTIENLDEVTIRFAGDSGDGKQLTGTQFTNTTAILGNDLSTLPDYPAEIRAPAGTLFGVSGFQIHFGSTEINTPGDHFDVLVAMNAAALKVNLPRKILTDGFPVWTFAVRGFRLLKNKPCRLPISGKNGTIARSNLVRAIKIAIRSIFFSVLYILDYSCSAG